MQMESQTLEQSDLGLQYQILLKPICPNIKNFLFSLFFLSLSEVNTCPPSFLVWFGLGKENIYLSVSCDLFSENAVVDLTCFLFIYLFIYLLLLLFYFLCGWVGFERLQKPRMRIWIR